MTRQKKGFSLAELLIVIAIIAILAAIAIPVFGSQLDKARLAADLANVRAEYGRLLSEAMLDASDTDSNGEFEITFDFSTGDLYKGTKVELDGSVIKISRSSGERTIKVGTGVTVNGLPYTAD